MGFIISYPPDAEIYGEGEQAEYFYKVVNGSVRTYKTLKSGRRQIVAFHVPGDVFGLETRGEHAVCRRRCRIQSAPHQAKRACRARGTGQRCRRSTVDAHRGRTPTGPGSYPAICIAGAGACRRLSCRDGAAPLCQRRSRVANGSSRHCRLSWLDGRDSVSIVHAIGTPRCNHSSNITADLASKLLCAGPPERLTPANGRPSLSVAATGALILSKQSGLRSGT